MGWWGWGRAGRVGRGRALCGLGRGWKASWWAWRPVGSVRSQRRQRHLKLHRGTRHSGPQTRNMSATRHSMRRPRGRGAPCGLALALLVAAAVSGIDGAFNCPPKDGQYEDPKQCDKYYECDDGVATEKLCPDGLVFDPTIRKQNKCDQPFNVDCGDRIELQPPKGNANCPRRNGFFAHPDPSVCNKFFNCIEGDYTEIACTPGLHFDEYQGICVWPDTAGRQGCNAVDKKLKDGFECPKEAQADGNGQAVAHPKFAHPEDCQKFYVCLNGVEPRELGCSLGEVYNEEDQKCDAPENVAGCEDWYKDTPEVTGKGKPKKQRK